MVRRKCADFSLHAQGLDEDSRQTDPVRSQRSLARGLELLLLFFPLLLFLCDGGCVLLKHKFPAARFAVGSFEPSSEEKRGQPAKPSRQPYSTRGLRDEIWDHLGVAQRLFIHRSTGCGFWVPLGGLFSCGDLVQRGITAHRALSLQFLFLFVFSLSRPH